MLRRISLRRKTLLIVLALAFVPSLITLTVSYLTAVAAIRSHLIDQSRARLADLSQRLGDRIGGSAQGLRAVAERPDLASLLGGLLLDRPAGGDGPAHRDVPGLEPVWVLDGESIMGQLGEAATPPPPEELLATFSELAARAEPLFILEHRITERPFVELWAFLRIEPHPGTESPLWLARPLSVRSLLLELDETRATGRGRALVLSSGIGPLVANPADAVEIRLLRDQQAVPDLPEGVIELGLADPAPWVFLRTAVVSSLTRASGREVSWTLMEQLDTEVATTALSYGIWRIALFGVVFVALMGAFGIWVSTMMVTPIRRLRAGLQRLEMGELDHRLKLHTGDELEELAESANRMAEALQVSYKTLADKLLQLDDKAQQLAITHEVAKAINRSLDLGIVFRNVIEQIRRIVPSERVYLALLPDDRSHAQISYGWPEEEAQPALGRSFEIKGSGLDPCLDAQDVLLAGLSDMPDVLLDHLAVPRTWHACLVPLGTTSGPLGILILLDSLAESFRPQDVEILKQLAESLAIAVEHSHLYHQQERFTTQLEELVRERTRELEGAQEQLIRTEKLAAAGELAANVAHEINNPLSIIKNYIKLLQSQLLQPRQATLDTDMARDGLRIITEEIERIARIVDQLRKVYVPTQATISAVAVNEEIRQMVELFRHTFHQKKLVVDTQFDDRLDKIQLCGDYLRQIIINFLRNAHDACAEKGRIVVSTRCYAPEPGWFTVFVADDGAGIRREHLDKIFDPFFTTKKEGKGTGLGLSVSYGLARNMGGTIEVASEVGRGTEMRLVLPRVLPAADSEGTAGERDVITRRGNQIIIG